MRAYTHVHGSMDSHSPRGNTKVLSTLLPSTVHLYNSSIFVVSIFCTHFVQFNIQAMSGRDEELFQHPHPIETMQRGIFGPKHPRPVIQDRGPQWQELLPHGAVHRLEATTPKVAVAKAQTGSRDV